ALYPQSDLCAGRPRLPVVQSRSGSSAAQGEARASLRSWTQAGDSTLAWQGPEIYMRLSSLLPWTAPGRQSFVVLVLLDRGNRQPQQVAEFFLDIDDDFGL